ncbi:carboxymuconolactone decarboxylase family protein [Azoarcus sp. PA01]|nr:carboxymuconolactone decarboxylase family protein [Azoarcus sp. PA01]
MRVPSISVLFLFCVPLMATRLDELSERDFPWYVRLVFAYQKRKYGQVLSPMWAWGRQPGIMFVFLLLIGRFKRLASPGPLLRTLLSVRISQLNHCDFCVDFNAHNFLAAQGAHEKIDFIDRWLEHPEVFSDEERAALAYAEAVTLNDEAGTARAMTALKRLFKDDAIVAITAWIGVQNLSSKFNDALSIPMQGFCRVPPRPPPG